MAASLARVWLKEPLDAAVLAASAVAFAGVAVMFAGSLSRGLATGDLLAVLMTLGLAGSIVLVRYWQEVSMMPAVLVAILLAAGLRIEAGPLDRRAFHPRRRQLARKVGLFPARRGRRAEATVRRDPAPDRSAAAALTTAPGMSIARNDR